MKLEQKRALPPGNLGWPLIGESITFFKNPLFFQEKHQKFGDIFKTHLFSRPTIVVRGSEASLFVARHENTYFEASPPVNLPLLWGKSSLAVQTGEKHLKLRQIIYPFFQTKNLSQFYVDIDNIMKNYFRKWSNRPQIIWYSELDRLTFDIAAKLILDMDQASSSEFFIWFKEWKKGVYGLPIAFYWTTLGKALRYRQKLQTYLQDFKFKSISSQCLLQQLLTSSDLSEEEISDQIFTLLFAGQDTLTSTLTSCCVIMTEQPNLLENIRQEIQDLDITELLDNPYLNYVCQEILRVFPSVNLGFRTIINDCWFKQYYFPKSWQLIYNIRDTLKNPEFWLEESTFCPERFHNPQQYDKQAYIPFGAGGIRDCLGKILAVLELKLFISNLSNYQWKLLDEQDTNMVFLPNLHPKDGFQVSVRKI